MNIDDAILRDAKSLAARSGRPLGSVLEDALRVLLAREEEAREHAESFRLPTGGLGGLRPGVDLEDKDALAELLGDHRMP